MHRVLILSHSPSARKSDGDLAPAEPPSAVEPRTLGGGRNTHKVRMLSQGAGQEVEMQTYLRPTWKEQGQVFWPWQAESHTNLAACSGKPVVGGPGRWGTLRRSCWLQLSLVLAIAGTTRINFLPRQMSLCGVTQRTLYGTAHEHACVTVKMHYASHVRQNLYCLVYLICSQAKT